jgi:hypothetical protein
VRWPSTVGKLALSATVLYVLLWLSFRLSPAWEAFALSVPYAGAALQAFLALYVAALTAWIGRHVLRNLLG